MSYDFADDVGAFAPYLNYVLNIERKRHRVYTFQSPLIDDVSNLGNDLRLADAGQIEPLTRGEEELYLCGGHFGLCVHDYGKMHRNPKAVINLCLMYENNTWTEELKKNPFPLYLWGPQGFEKW